MHSYLRSEKPAEQLLLLEPFQELETILPDSLRESFGKAPIHFGWEKFKSLDSTSWLPSGTKSFRVFIHPAYSRKFPELSREISDYFRNRGLDRQNVLAKNAYARLWTRNFFRHLAKEAEERNSFRLLSKQLPENPKKIGCFLGASPELESELDWIRNNQEKVFLLSSDTALGFLLENRIRPRAILSIDSGLGTAYHFPESVPKDIPIFTWFGGSARIFDLENPKILYLSTHPLDQILGSRFFPNAPILENPTLNLAGMAVSILRALGAGGVFLKGVGFSREGGKTHCRSSGYERYDRFYLQRKKSLFSARYSPESRWNQRTIVLESLRKWSPIRILTEIESETDLFTGWEEALEKFSAPFPGNLGNWTNWVSAISEVPAEIKELVPREARLLSGRSV